MKTRALLTCDTRVLESKVQGLKPKELRRHIDHIAADLGATDTDTLLARILEAILRLQDAEPSEDGGRSESESIAGALSGLIEVTNDNWETVLRLIVISATYLRHLMDQRARELRRAEHAAHRHHDGHACGDPHCQEHHPQTATG
ncbi:MAG: hypothetical protein ACM3ST_11035 [Bdellovibrio bacteriovorus]